MQLTAGTRVGAYEISGTLGAGGMGEVYRARDTRLNRDVAIKILPELFAADAERTARFQREAEVLATLNHPNIAQIYGFEQTDGVRAIVLELVDGPTLADRIATGPISLDEALPIARQIAEALEAAHERDIIHRDLKPANIKITSDGKVKVLDFGLAKATQASDSRLQPPDLSNSPTLTSPALATHAGVILGTAAYMSPEQAKGKALDRRTDMWAFGCVLYEMLTAKRAFEGADITDMLAEILKSEADWKALPAATPQPIKRLLRRCLSKDPHTRMSDARDARLEIEDALHGSPAESVAASHPFRRPWVAWAIALVAIMVAATALLIPRVRVDRSTPLPTARFNVSLPARMLIFGTPLVPAVSPDGRHIAFNSFPRGPGDVEIWLRSLDTADPRPIRGIGVGAFSPFWSPDSTQLAFFIDNKLKKISLAGGVSEAICDVSDGALGGAWNSDGIILFSTRRGLMQVPAAGGEPRLVTRVKERGAHAWPQFLPDGRRFIFFSSPDNAIHLGSLDSSDTAELLKADAQALYVPPGYLLFIRQGTLLAQPFDAARAELSGVPVQVATQIAVIQNWGHAGFSASANGILVYRSLEGAVRPVSKLVWLNRQGQKVAEIPGEFDDRIVSLSPTSSFLALDKFESASGPARDLWLVDHRRGTSTRLTSDPSDECCPIWSPDGKRVVFNSNREGSRNLYEIEPDSLNPAQLLLKTPEPKFPKDWSRDGRFIAYEAQGSGTRGDLWLLPLFGDRTPIPVAQTGADESGGRFSPDGKWIAYVSNQSGRYEVYVQSLVDQGRRRMQISTEGGYYPRWRGDGRELFYVSPSRKLMTVTVVHSASDLQLDVPQPLFDMPITDPASQQFTDKYDVTPDGQRFVAFQILDEQDSVNLTVVMNWKPSGAN
jgi:Tol biopolymer transport system component